MEKTVKHFCTTASRIKKDAVRSVKAANIAIGISAITIGKMKLEQLKKKLPNINISIDYTGTWKGSPCAASACCRCAVNVAKNG